MEVLLPETSTLVFGTVLAAAAGADLGLAILILALAPLLGWPSAPGGLPVLQAPPVVASAGLLYAAEVIMERSPRTFGLWHLFQRWVRLLGLVLLSVLLTAGTPLPERIMVGTYMLMVGGGTYLAASGWQALLILRERPSSAGILTAAGVDIASGALLLLALDEPIQALVAAVALLLPTAFRFRQVVRGHRALVAASRSWLRSLLLPGTWTRWEDLPDDVQSAAREAGRLGHASGRGSRALLLTRQLEPGWLLVEGGSGAFIGADGDVSGLERSADAPIRDGALHARMPVSIRGDEGELLIARDGPGRDDLAGVVPLSARY